MNTRTPIVGAALAATLPLTMAFAAPSGPELSPSGSADQSIPQVLVLSGTKKPNTQLLVSSTRIAQRQPVTLRFIVTNNGRKGMRYSFPTGQQFDVVVQDSKGNEVWRWSQGRTFPSRLTSLALHPGESATFNAVWPAVNSLDHPVANGEYAVFAQLTPDLRPAITGGVIVNTDTDPDNIGIATAGSVQTGAIRQVPVAPVEAAVKVTVGE